MVQYGVKPNVNSLRIFGCSAYAHVPKVERHKLDPKARKCVLLGYGTTQKGYRLYDLTRMKVIHSRDFVFDEESMLGIKKEPPSNGVELKVDDEIDVKQAEGQLSTPSDQEPSRRSMRDRQKPDRYGHALTTVSDEQKDPVSVAEVRASPDRLQWEKAMESDFISLHLNGVWELVEPPSN